MWERIKYHIAPFGVIFMVVYPLAFYLSVKLLFTGFPFYPKISDSFLDYCYTLVVFGVPGVIACCGYLGILWAVRFLDRRKRPRGFPVEPPRREGADGRRDRLG